MPTFVIGSGVGDNYATFLLPIPDVVWFKSAVLGALYEMTNPNNWIERGDVAVSFAVEESAKMLNDFKLTNFNPFPIGLILPFGSSTIPDGYLPCDGSSVMVADYPELYAVIGNNYGGDSTSFALPQLNDNVVVGAGDTFAIGDSGGSTTVSLSVAELPSHNHSATAPTVIDPSHSHVESSAIPTAITIGPGVPAPSALPSVGSTAPALTGITVLAPDIGYSGGDGAHENMQPYLALKYMIYAGRI